MNATIVVTPFDQLSALLESDEFYAEVAVASSSLAFFRRVRTHPVTKRVMDVVNTDEATAAMVLEYADKIARQASGSLRSERDAALCACVVALSNCASPRFDDFLRFLRTTKTVALRWASEVAEMVASQRMTTLQTKGVWSASSSATIVGTPPAGETRTPEEPALDVGLSVA